MTISTKITNFLRNAMHPMSDAEIARGIEAPTPSVRRTRREMEDNNIVVAATVAPLTFRLARGM